MLKYHHQGAAVTAGAFFDLYTTLIMRFYPSRFDLNISTLPA